MFSYSNMMFEIVLELLAWLAIEVFFKRIISPAFKKIASFFKWVKKVVSVFNR